MGRLMHSKASQLDGVKGFTHKAIGKRLGGIVADCCEREGIKQYELAKRWGIDTTHLSAVMTGNKHISVTIIIAAIEHGGVNLNYLIGGAGPVYLDGSDMNKALQETLTLLKKHERALTKLAG